MEKRLMRLVWNDRNWETPIKKKYNPALWKDGKHNVSFEKAFGFGGEDWLFNSRYNIDGFQYGYIRGVDKLQRSLEYIDELYLFTIDPITKNRLLVAKICNVEIIEGFEKAQKIILPILKKFKEQHLDELKTAEAHYQALDIFPIQANIRFKMADVTNYGYIVEIPSLKTPSFNRFTPYRIDNQLEKKLLNHITIPATFIFRKGKSKSVKSHTRNNAGGNSINKRIHTDITDDLYKYLLSVGMINKNNISIENSRVGGCIVDGVIENNKKYSFFEVKTSSVATANIRNAIGQLLEYSLLDKTLELEKLIIVGPAGLNKDEAQYFDRVRNVLNLNLEYWECKMNETDLKFKFKIY